MAEILPADRARARRSDPAELRQAARYRFHAYFRIHGELMRLDPRGLARLGVSPRGIGDAALRRAFGTGEADATLPSTGTR